MHLLFVSLYFLIIPLNLYLVHSLCPLSAISDKICYALFIIGKVPKGEEFFAKQENFSQLYFVYCKENQRSMVEKPPLGVLTIFKQGLDFREKV